MRYKSDRTITLSTPDVIDNEWAPKGFSSGNDAPSFTTVIHTWNYTNYAVSVSDRFGLSYVAHPIYGTIGHRSAQDQGKALRKGVYFTVEYRQRVDFRDDKVHGSIFDSRCVRNEATPNPIIRGLKENYQIVQEDGKRYKIHYIDFFYSLEKIKEMKDCIYLQELDLLISTCEDTSMLPHPFCEEGFVELGTRHAQQTRVPTQGLTVYFVDNNGNTPPLFMNLGGKVIEISPTVDLDCKAGFYFFEHQIDFDNRNRVLQDDGEVEFYTLEDIRAGLGPIQVYMTKEEAKTFGHPEKEFEEKLKERDRQWEIEKRELESNRLKEKLDFEREMDALKREQQMLEAKHKQELAEMERKHKEALAKLEEEKAKLKAELEEISGRRKDYYESRSSSRKDSSEGWITALKIAAVVVPVGVAVFKLFF